MRISNGFSDQISKVNTIIRKLFGLWNCLFLLKNYVFAMFSIFFYFHRRKISRKTKIKEIS